MAALGPPGALKSDPWPSTDKRNGPNDTRHKITPFFWANPTPHITPFSSAAYTKTLMIPFFFFFFFFNFLKTI